MTDPIIRVNAQRLLQQLQNNGQIEPEAHEKNKADYHREFRRDLDTVINSRYNASVFREQLNWFKSRFYTVTGLGDKSIYRMRQIEQNLPPVKIQKPAIYETLKNRFGDDLQPLLSTNRVLRFLTSCASEKYCPHTEKFCLTLSVTGIVRLGLDTLQ